MTPFVWSFPPSSASRSMSTTPLLAVNTFAVIRVGFPNAKSPRSSTARPFTCPTATPCTFTMSFPRRIHSRTFSARREWRYFPLAIACRTWFASTALAPASRAQKLASATREARVPNRVTSLA